MNEKLLHFIWQFQYFSKQGLCTTDGQPIHVLHPGNYNVNQGPDFLHAKMMIAETCWVGHVELHVFSSDWVLHGHQQDANYNNIILHVVWQHNQSVPLNFPTLELCTRVPKLLLGTYSLWQQTNTGIPCGKQLPIAEPFLISKWKERLLAERWEHKSKYILAMLGSCNFHWEEVCWQLIARHFGMPVNMDAFEAVAASLPLSLLYRLANDRHYIESLLFGQAGMLNVSFSESYPLKLKETYQYLQHKYQLQPPPVNMHFLRMRPANFPTIRLAQLSAFMQQRKHLFATLLNIKKPDEVASLFNIGMPAYWDTHYRFESISPHHTATPGKALVQQLLINVFIPLLFTYGVERGADQYISRAIDWLHGLPAEKNNITQRYREKGISNATAFDSQALIQLNREFCQQKRCLECAIGNHLLKIGDMNI